MNTSTKTLIAGFALTATISTANAALPNRGVQIETYRTTDTRPHKVCGPETHHLVLQLHKRCTDDKSISDFDELSKLNEGGRLN